MELGNKIFREPKTCKDFKELPKLLDLPGVL
jgi:hypothetical protein